jgi:hypothetical protein
MKKFNTADLFPFFEYAAVSIKRSGANGCETHFLCPWMGKPNIVMKFHIV